MGKRLKYKKIIFASILSVVLICASVGVVRAVFNGDTDAVHINPDEIENSTLIIGTHLVHISALTDEIYDIASESTEQSGQTEMYYKSELAGGTWYMISDASQLSDITSKEKQIDKSVIQGLYLRYHTKSDGITYDLMDGKAICLFDTVNPYDLENLPEMDALKTQYEGLTEKSKKSETDENNLEKLKNVLKQGEVLKEQHKTTDKTISKLNASYVANASNNDVASVLQKIMKKVDNDRRIDVYDKLSSELLPNLLTSVQEVEEGGYVDYDLTDAIASALESTQQKLTECEGSKVDGSSNALAAVESECIQRIIDAANSDDTEQITKLTEQYTDLKNIESGISVNLDREAELIESVILPKADEMILAAESSDDVEKSFAETEFLAKAVISRVSVDEGKEFIEDRIAELNALVEKITDAQMKQKAAICKEDSVNSLQDALVNMEAASETEMSRLLAEKKTLQTERLKALDENDLEGAQNIEEELENLDTQISELERILVEVLNSETSNDLEKAQAQAALQSGFAATKIESLRQQSLSDLGDAQYAAVLVDLESMGALSDQSPSLVLDALKEVYKKAAAILYLEEGTAESGEDDAEKVLQALELIATAMEIKETQNSMVTQLEFSQICQRGETICGYLEAGIYVGVDELITEMYTQIDTAAAEQDSNLEKALRAAVGYEFTKAEMILNETILTITDEEDKVLAQNILTQIAGYLETQEISKEQMAALITAVESLETATEENLVESTQNITTLAQNISESGYVGLSEAEEILKKSVISEEVTNGLNTISTAINSEKEQNDIVTENIFTSISQQGDNVASYLDVEVYTGVLEMLSSICTQIENMAAETEGGSDSELVKALKELAIYKITESERILNEKSPDITDEEERTKAQEISTKIEEIKAGWMDSLGLAEEQIGSLIASVQSIEDADGDELTENIQNLTVLAQAMPISGYAALCEAEKILEAQASEEQLGTQNVELKDILDTIEDIAADTAAEVTDGPSQQDMVEILEGVLDTPQDDWTDKETALCILALNQCGEESRNADALALAKEIITDAYNDENKYVFEKLENEASEFIPLDIFAQCCSYRYVYHEGNKTGILQKGTVFYELSAFSKRVKTKGENEEEMDTYARYQSSLYVSCEYMNTTFQVSAEYVDNTKYAVLKTQEMEDTVAEMVEQLSAGTSH